MNKVLYALLTLAAFTSCANSFNIQGTSNVSSLDGRKLYLKTAQGDSLVNLDSCDVVHGQFAFHGTIDSVEVAQVFMDDVNLQFQSSSRKETLRSDWTIRSSVSAGHR